MVSQLNMRSQDCLIVPEMVSSDQGNNQILFAVPVFMFISVARQKPLLRHLFFGTEWGKVCLTSINLTF